MQSIRRKFFTDTAFLTAAQVLIRLRSLITLPVFAYTLGAEGYGIFTQINVTVTLFIPFVSFRLETSAVRFLSAEDDKKSFRDTFSSGLFLIIANSLLVSILLAAFSIFSSKILFGDIAYAEFMAIGGMYMTSSAVYTYLSNYFRIKQRIKTLAVINFLQSLLGIGFMLLAVYLGYGVRGAFYALTAINLAFIAVLYVAIGRQTGWFGFNYSKLLAMVKYGLPLMPNSLLQWGVNYADRLVITQILGLAAIGTYSASYSIGQLLSLLITPISLALFPFLSRFWDKGEFEETRRYFSYVTRYFIILALPASIGLAMLSQSLLASLTPEEFATSRLLVFWISLGFLGFGLYQINVYVFHLVQKTAYVTGILVLGLVINLALNIYLVPLIGINGSAFATAVTFLSMSFMAIYYGEKFIGYRIDWLAVIKSGFASAVMALLLLRLPAHGLLGISVAVVLGCIVYFIVLVALGTFNRREISNFRRLIASYLPR